MTIGLKRRPVLELTALAGVLVFAASARAEYRVAPCGTRYSYTYYADSHDDRYGTVLHRVYRGYRPVPYYNAPGYVSHGPTYVPLTYGTTYVAHRVPPARRYIAPSRYRHTPRVYVSRSHRYHAPRHVYRARGYYRPHLRHHGVSRFGPDLHHHGRARYLSRNHRGRHLGLSIHLDR